MHDAGGDRCGASRSGVFLRLIRAAKGSGPEGGERWNAREEGKLESGRWLGVVLGGWVPLLVRTLATAPVIMSHRVYPGLKLSDKALDFNL